MTDEGLATAAVDADGIVAGWSTRAGNLLGWSTEQVIGRPAAGLLAAALPVQARDAVNARAPWDGQVVVLHRDGHRVEVRLRAYPVAGAGERTQWFVLGSPAAGAPWESGGSDVGMMLDWAFTQSPLHLGLVDTELRHLRLNEVTWRAFGLGAEADGLGRPLTDLLPGVGLGLTPDFEAGQELLHEVIRTGIPARNKHVIKPPGELREQVWEIVISAVKDPTGRARGAFEVAVDVTEQHLARERLALVNDASTRIGGTLDVTRTAEELVEVTIPRLADSVAVDLLECVLHGDEPVTGPIAGTAPARRIASGSVETSNPENLLQAGQMISYPARSPAATALATGQGAMYDKTMVVPVRARGATLGLATFVRHQRPEPFAADDLILAEEIVARAAVCIDNARRYSRERAAALTLQRSLLPHRLPRQAAVDVAYRYLPAGSHVAVGGDWFDVIRLSGSRVGLVVGDVVGHGTHAAATMGRLRTAVRTLADLDLPPDELLTRLDDVVTRLVAEEGTSPDDGAITDLTATCLYAVYDPVTRHASLARAGHPYPALVSPDGVATFLDLPAGPPLGLGGLPFEAVELDLPEGSLLVLYTDGLIESRHRDIQTRLDELLAVLTMTHRPVADTADAAPVLESVCDTMIKTMLTDRPTDDVAFLLARTHTLDADRIATWDLPADPAVVADARAGASRQLRTWGLGELAATTELVVSELVTNAIRHAEPPIQLRMILDDALICEVSDASSTAPHLRRAHRLDEGGRGLLLVAHLTERWGTRHTPTGKIIWTKQPLPATRR
jgi:serine phosphatase RsbU (regulator of sigma subunit)/PAS domain-containing protein/anti-sigma regulatory factor (Ser/Thr protein kinase)